MPVLLKGGTWRGSGWELEGGRWHVGHDGHQDGWFVGGSLGEQFLNHEVTIMTLDGL